MSLQSEGQLKWHFEVWQRLLASGIFMKSSFLLALPVASRDLYVGFFEELSVELSRWHRCSRRAEPLTSCCYAADDWERLRPAREDGASTTEHLPIESYRLVMQNDDIVVLYTSVDVPVWSTHSNPKAFNSALPY
ncbi:hypothetical protein L7F22_055627, partial [Adiantum nelumboides]|nr:hypothetical protein [Adiantum nelumboides]